MKRLLAILILLALTAPADAQRRRPLGPRTAPQVQQAAQPPWHWLWMRQNTDGSCAWRVLEALLLDAGHGEAAADAAKMSGGCVPGDVHRFLDDRKIPYLNGSDEAGMRANLPCKVVVSVPGEEDRHALAVVKIDGYVWVVDPNAPGSVQRWERAEFQARWTTYGFLAIKRK
jgi:hypothetical protein